MVSALYKECREGQNWPLIYRSGSGVFADDFIPEGTIVCNYGGTPVRPEHFDAWVEHFPCFSHHGTYLKIRYSSTESEPDTEKYLIHTYPSVKKLFGPYLSHFSSSPNLIDFVFVDLDTDELDVLFFARRNIPAGIKLGWDFDRFATHLYTK